MKEDIILVGGGGHCKACIDVIEAQGRFRIAGIVDMARRIGTKVLDYRIIAGDRDLAQLVKKHKNFLIAMGHIKDPEKRKKLFEMLKKLKASLPVIISPFSHVSRYAEIGEGTIVLHGAYVNAGVSIGRNCIINTSSVIEHDSAIGDHCHISTGAIIAGGCSVEEGVFVGANSVIANNLSIVKGAVVGAGSVVVRSIEKGGIYAGNPAGKLDKNA